MSVILVEGGVPLMGSVRIKGAKNASLPIMAASLLTGKGASVYAPDLRGGAALLIAALAARGVSEIRGIRHIRRGYSRLTSRLRALGGRVYMG
ncbi:MAG: hypothetical protein AB1796_04215 [Bacillota bacterium]